MREPLTPFSVVGMSVIDADYSGLNMTKHCLGDFVRITKRCKQRACCLSKIVGGPMSHGQPRTIMVRCNFAVRLMIIDAVLDHRSDPSLPHATNETVPSLWPDRGVAAQLLLRGPRAARADPLLSRYEAPSSFVWESSTKDHRFRRRSRLLSIATISPLVKPTPGSRVQTYGDKRHCADPDGQRRQFPFYFQSLADYFSFL